MNERLQAAIVATAYKINEGKPKEQLIAELIVLGANQAEAEEAYRLAANIVHDAQAKGGWHDFVIGGLFLFGAYLAVIFYDKSSASFWYGLAMLGFVFGCYRVVRGAWKTLQAKLRG